MSKLIMMRHGQSSWNNKNLFTGWVDVPLTKKGIGEALDGGALIKDIPLDVIFMSTLIRSQMTAMLAVSQHLTEKVPVVMHEGDDKISEWSKIYNEETEKQCIPAYVAWELNERMYGELQGLNKADTMAKFGKEQVHQWRRSYDIAPPEGESLELTAARTIPYFEENIVPHLDMGKNVFISAHGNSLRSIVMQLDGLSRKEVLQLELGTGVPIIYNYEKGTFTKEKL
jgi:2,3-bisphosphoglycerate-dependent phosphoglycerate mutase